MCILLLSCTFLCTIQSIRNQCSIEHECYRYSTGPGCDSMSSVNDRTDAPLQPPSPRCSRTHSSRLSNSTPRLHNPHGVSSVSHGVHALTLSPISSTMSVISSTAVQALSTKKRAAAMFSGVMTLFVCRLMFLFTALVGRCLLLLSVDVNTNDAIMMWRVARCVDVAAEMIRWYCCLQRWHTIKSNEADWSDRHVIERQSTGEVTGGSPMQTKVVYRST